MFYQVGSLQLNNNIAVIQSNDDRIRWTYQTQQNASHKAMYIRKKRIPRPNEFLLDYPKNLKRYKIYFITFISLLWIEK